MGCHDGAREQWPWQRSRFQKRAEWQTGNAGDDSALADPGSQDAGFRASTVAGSGSEGAGFYASTVAESRSQDARIGTNLPDQAEHSGSART